MDHSNQTMPVTFRDRSLTVVKEMNGVNFESFWDYFARGIWETDTLSMIEGIKDSKTIFLDVGGWIGPTALWAAFKQRSVITFEPDPVALKALRANIDLNPDLKDRIKIMPFAVGSSNSDIELFSSRPGLSETSIFNVVQRRETLTTFDSRFTVPCIDISQFIRSLAPNENSIFLKIDIEGAEFALLPHIADVVTKYDITVFVSIHGTNIVEASHDVTMASRLLKIAKCLEPFVGLNWYSYANGLFSEVKKFDYLVTALNNLNANTDLIISRKALADL